MILSEKIVFLRRNFEYTKDEFAKELDIEKELLIKWESGQEVPEMSYIIAMAKLFSIDPNFFLYDDLEPVDIGFEKEEKTKVDKSGYEEVSQQVADKFILAYKKQAKLIALGVFLCVISPIPLIFLDDVNMFFSPEISVVVGFVWIIISVCIAISLFLSSDRELENYKYINEGKFKLSLNVLDYITEKKMMFKKQRNRNTITSILLIALSPIPVLINVTLDAQGEVNILTALLLLIMVAIAVYRLVSIERCKNSYEVLLSDGEIDSETLLYRRKKEDLDSAFWCTALVVYLTWSFLSHDWFITWIVWPIAAVISGSFSFLMSMSNDEDDKNDKN